jgi:arylsulfatase A
MLLRVLITAFAFSVVACCASASAQENRPNIVLVLADDLGIGELGCYGQTKIQTPHIDRLAAQGMRFTQAYSPSPVCAPTRGSLLTGLHLGHAYIRDNLEVRPEGQHPIAAETVTIASLLKQRGYATACIGKWGLGPVGSSGEPSRQGFDHFFGINCQRVAHNLYPTHVWRNDQRIDLEGNEPKNLVGKHYTPDMMADEAVEWMRAHREQPFFLYFATPLPHLALQAPEEAVAPYRGRWDDPPYDGSRGYLPNETPRATYAAMVTRLDEHVGRLMDELAALGLEEKTLVIFTSDNGPTFDVGGADSPFFHSAQGRRGLKGQLYEGGIRVPLIVRWPGRVAAGAVSEHVTALYDFFATAAEVAGTDSPASDAISLVPVLTGDGEQPVHDYLYWEHHSRGGWQAIRRGKWKGVRVGLHHDPAAAMELYDLAADPNETTNVAAASPVVVEELMQLLRAARTPSHLPRWNFPLKGEK